MLAPTPALPDSYLPTELAADTLITRVHRTDCGPVWFGPAPGSLPTGRFDAPGGEYGTLYVARQLTGAFVETVLRRANRIIARPFIDQRAWSVLRLKRDCSLALLHGEGLVFHGVTNDICAGDLYAPSQALAFAFWQKFPLDGIAYRARHNNDEICYALNDRVKVSDLELVETHRFADHPDIVDRLLRQHGAAVDPQTVIPMAGSLS